MDDDEAENERKAGPGGLFLTLLIMTTSGVLTFYVGVNVLAWWRGEDSPYFWTVCETGPEVCDNVDNDCDGLIDEGFGVLRWYPDQDGDDYGSQGESVMFCARPDGYAGNSLDCADDRRTINPGVPEGCDKIDNNCNGQVDEGPATWYYDGDRDGFGEIGSGNVVGTCADNPSGYLAGNPEWTPFTGDCDGRDPSINPKAPEVDGDGADNDCDGELDELR